MRFASPVVVLWVCALVLLRLVAILRNITVKRLITYGIKVAKRTPCVRSIIRKEVNQFRDKLREDFAKTAHAPTMELPLERANVNKLMNKLEAM